MDLRLRFCPPTIRRRKRCWKRSWIETPENLEIPAQPEVVDPSSLPSIANDAPANVLVWKGSDEKLAQFLASALGENNLTARVNAEAGVTAIYVAAGNEVRACEIVREVTQGAPPK